MGRGGPANFPDSTDRDYAADFRRSLGKLPPQALLPEPRTATARLASRSDAVLAEGESRECEQAKNQENQR